MNTREFFGTLGQYLSILILGVAIGFGIGKGITAYWVMVTAGAVVWGIATKMKGK